MDNKQLLIHGGVLVVGAGIGFGTGYLVFKKRYARIAEAEIESVKQAYAKNAQPKPDLQTLRRSNFVDPELEVAAELLDTAKALAEQEGYSTTEGEDSDADAFRRAHGRTPTTFELIQMGSGIPPEEADVRDIHDHDDSSITEGNIFDNPESITDDFGPGEDVQPTRSPDRPYIISVEEWYGNELNYDQVTLTWWADDEVLADVQDRMIREIDDVVGGTSLHRFGTLSDNADIVYVRNERLKVDYEITKDERNYSEIIHGISREEVNSSGVPRRMRSNDDE